MAIDEEEQRSMEALVASFASQDAWRATTLEGKFRAAATAVKQDATILMFTAQLSEPAQFRAACLAVLVSGVSEDDKARVITEHKALSEFSFVLEGAARGIPVSLDFARPAFACAIVFVLALAGWAVRLIVGP